MKKVATTLTEEQAAADALIANLPNAVKLRAVESDAPSAIPDAAKSAIIATFVGARSAELALVLLDPAFLADAAGEQTLVRTTDIVFPAFEQSSAVFGTGVLGEAIEGDAGVLFADPESVLFELLSDEGTVGWYIVRVRAEAPVAAPHRSIEGRLSRINEVEMALTVEIGRTRMPIRNVLGLEVGAVVELDRAVGAPADVLLNGRLIAHGEVVVVDQEFAVRITRILDGAEATR
jgi:flagellar motor switch protein FliN/FliY